MRNLIISMLLVLTSACGLTTPEHYMDPDKAYEGQWVDSDGNDIVFMAAGTGLYSKSCGIIAPFNLVDENGVDKTDSSGNALHGIDANGRGKLVVTASNNGTGCYAIGTYICNLNYDHRVGITTFSITCDASTKTLTK